MPNPYLPSYEYIPDGEPRVFGDRVYIYGSHDNAGSTTFCDFKLRVWSASIDDLDHWREDGDSFHTRPDEEHEADVDWSNNELYAPDVVEKDGKYYLYFYIVGAPGGVAVSDVPEGPFKLLSRYQSPEGAPPEFGNHGGFIDPGVLVDEDGKVYIYWGYLDSHMAQINPDNMYEILPNTYIPDIIPVEEPYNFFEAASPRKVGDTYYFIYSPKTGSRLVYATSKSPTGPFEYRGIIVDNGVDYPGGNDHGSICKIKDQWYIFYHRMTNNTIFSRRACVERIQILPDGSIPQVEQTSMGFSESLSPYKRNKADLACVLIGGNYITEYDMDTHPVIKNMDGAIIGFKYFDFKGDDGAIKNEMSIRLKRIATNGTMEIRIDHAEQGELIGKIEIDEHVSTEEWMTLKTKVASVTGRHALYFIFKAACADEVICEVESFSFE